MNTCVVNLCDLPVHAKNLCRGHYRRSWDGKSLDPLFQTRGYERVECQVPNCVRVCTSNGFCSPCNKNWKRLRVVAPVRERISCVDSQGYERWNRCHPDNKWGRQISAHRAVMQLHLNRELFEHENVHHVNGDRLDNRLENLELWSSSQPPGQRVEDKLGWAEELLRQYGRLL